MNKNVCIHLKRSMYWTEFRPHKKYISVYPYYLPSHYSNYYPRFYQRYYDAMYYPKHHSRFYQPTQYGIASVHKYKPYITKMSKTNKKKWMMILLGLLFAFCLYNYVMKHTFVEPQTNVALFSRFDLPDTF